MSFGKPGASGALQRELYREDGGEGELGNAMLNDVLAVCVAGAVVVVIATILGAVELLRKPVTAIAGRWSCFHAWLPLGTSPPPRTAVMRAATPASSALRTPYARFVRVVGCSGCSMRFG